MPINAPTLATLPPPLPAHSSSFSFPASSSRRTKRSKGKQRAGPMPPPPAALITSSNAAFGHPDFFDFEEVAEDLLGPVLGAEARFKRADNEMRSWYEARENDDDPHRLVPDSLPIFHVLIAVRFPFCPLP